jgi:plasmid stabilization system protein ParE
VKYQLTHSAQRDVREITRHIRTVQNSPQNARLVTTRLAAHFKKLANQPGLGHGHAEIDDPAIRVSYVTGLMVVYDATTSPLLVLRVLHPARDISKIAIRD